MKTHTLPEPGTIERVFYNIDSCLRGHRVVQDHAEAYVDNKESLVDFSKCCEDCLLDARSSLSRYHRRVKEGFDA
jgi:hypothetical protein